MAIGRDNSDHCSGFEERNGRRFFGSRVAVSIIDVRDLNKVRLVQRKCVAIENARWSNSAVNWNLDQAHKMIGMYSDSTANLLTLPVNYSTRTTTGGIRYYEYKSAIGLMRWDLSKYDDKKDEKNQNVLENVATIIHPKGSVKRTIIFKLPQGGKDKRVVLNLSDTHLSIADLDNLSTPWMLSTVEIAPYIRTVYRFGNYLVEQVNLGRHYDQFNEFRVKKIGTGDINEAKILASFKQGQVSNVIRWKNLLVIFKRHFTSVSSSGYPRYDYQKSDVVIYDFSNPEAPKKRGSATLPFNFYPSYYFYCGGFDMGYYFGYYGNNQSWIATSTGISSLFSYYDRTTRKSVRLLTFVNFSNPDKISYTKTTLSTGNNYSTHHFNLTALDDNTFYVVSRERHSNYKQGNHTFYRYRYLATPWTLKQGKWTRKTSINLPGRLMKAYKAKSGKTTFISYDYGYIARQSVSGNNTYYRYQQIFRLYLLEQLSNGKASLQDFKSFSSWRLGGLIVDNEKLYLNANRDWYYMQKKNLDWYDRSNTLMIFDLSKKRFEQKFSAPTRTSNIRLSGIQNNRLFMTLQGEGILVADVSNPASPKGLHFERTLGWANNLEISKDQAFVASGHFGIFQLSLTKKSIPSL